MDEDTPRCSRRQALTGGAALTAATLASSSAGCLSLLPPVGQQIRYGRVDVPAPVGTEPRHRRWIPAQHEVPDIELQRGAPSWLSVTPGNLGVDELGASYGLGQGLVLANFEYVGYDFEHYDYVHDISDLGVVAEGDIDSAVVAETVLDGGYQRAGTYHGWTLFDRTDIPRTVAVSDSAVVLSRGEQRRTHIERVLDAGDGRIKRYHEAVESYATFSENVGSHPTVLYNFAGGFTPVEPEHSGMGYTFDEDGAYLVYYSQYAESKAPSSDEIKQYLDADSEPIGRAYSIDIETDDTYTEVQMHIQASKFRDTETDDRAPHVMWGVEDTGKRIAIRHEAGDTIPVDRLSIDPRQALVDDPGPGTVLQPDDEFQIAVEAFPNGEDTVSVFYQPAGGQSTTALFQYTPDEQSSLPKSRINS